MSAAQLSDAERALLVQVAAGDLAAEAPAVRAAATNPHFREALMELQQAQTALDAAGRTERAVFRHAGTHEPMIRPNLVAETIGRLAATPQAGPVLRKASHRPWIAVAAIAAVVLGWLMLRGGEAPTPPVNRDQQQLGSRWAIELLAFDGATLRWRCAQKPARFRVSIYDPTKPDEPVVEVSTAKTEATLEPTDLQLLRPGFWWKVAACGPDEQVLGEQAAALPQR
jgi:hypothetical protein